MFSFVTTSQSSYNSMIRNAENNISALELDSSLFYYDKAFEAYDYPFVKDVLAASFVAHYADDTKYCINIWSF